MKDKYRVADLLPEGTSGIWRVERFTITKKEVEAQSARAFQNRGRIIPEGTYTQLLRGGGVVMSDTPDEVRDHLWAILEAKGRVLIAGLGLGMYLKAVLEKPEVAHATVIEKSPDVIALVAPHYQKAFGDRVEIIQGDIFTWAPPKGARWDVAWFDIWDNQCSDNLEEMTRLHRKFARRAKWKGSWGREMCRRLR